MRRAKRMVLRSFALQILFKDEAIREFYSDPAVEAAYQEWLPKYREEREARLRARKDARMEVQAAGGTV